MALSDALIDDSCKVYTPDTLAQAIVSRLSIQPDQRCLEPCCGDGAFLRALSSHGIKPKRITAVELDETHYADHELATTQRGKDFFKWSPQNETPFEVIVGNPPYLLLSKVPEGLRTAALATPLPIIELPSSRYNYWALFLCRCLQLLRKGGSIGFVLPAAWDYADYAQPVREELPRLFGTFEVHRCHKPLFDGVQEGSVIIIGKEFLTPNSSMQRFEYSDSPALIAGLMNGEQSCLEEPERSFTMLQEKGASVAASSVFTISIGAVTGHSSYFLLSDPIRALHQIPLNACVPVLTRARHLQRGTVDKGYWRNLLELGERVLLFRPESNQLNVPGIRNYLEMGICGACRIDAFKIRNRRPWYVAPLPKTPHGFMSGLGRLCSFGCFACCRPMVA